MLYAVERSLGQYQARVDFAYEAELFIEDKIHKEGIEDPNRIDDLTNRAEELYQKHLDEQEFIRLDNSLP